MSSAQAAITRAANSLTASRESDSRYSPTLRFTGAVWCNVVYIAVMSIAEKTIRQSVSLPAHVARRVRSVAQTSKTSASRVIADLIESGLDAREQEKKRFLDLANRLAHSRDAKEQKRLKEELARMTFGE